MAASNFKTENNTFMASQATAIWRVAQLAGNN